MLHLSEKKERLCLQEYYDALREILVHQIKEGTSASIKQEVKELKNFPFWKNSELAWALLTANSLLSQIDIPSIPLIVEKSGCILLLKKACLHWDGLPYPRLHAELGALLAFLALNGREEYAAIALQMGKWQLRLLDHKNKPLFSPWLQEGSLPYSELLGAYFFLFNQLSLLDEKTFAPIANALWKQLESIPKENTPFWDLIACSSLVKAEYSQLSPKQESIFSDLSCDFLKKESAISTICLFGSGCKSTLGLFLYENGGVVSYGPELLPLGKFDEFGLANRPSGNSKIEEKEKECHFSFAGELSSISKYQGADSSIKDSGFSHCFIEGVQVIKEHALEISCHITSVEEAANLAFIFFIKASSIFVASSHKLNPRSLDRYKGPTAEVLFDVGGIYLSLQSNEGIKMMEVIPLAGDDSFWGADFLIAYTPLNKPSSWKIKPKSK